MVRGDVHAIRLSGRRGHVQRGHRFAVIVQADELLDLSTVVICPTSSSTPAASFHPQIVVDGEPTRVMCEMVGAVDARALGARLGYLTLDETREIEDSLSLVLELA